jgi:hypothetical protein
MIEEPVLTREIMVHQKPVCPMVGSHTQLSHQIAAEALGESILLKLGWWSENVYLILRL